MSVDIEIRSKGILKKQLKIEDVLLSHMGYGIMDESYRLIEGKTGEYTVVYDKENIGRGYEISLKKGSVELHLPLPCGASEIRAFYDYVRHICSLMGRNTFRRDGEETDFKSIEEYVKCDVNASLGALEHMESSIKNGEYRTMYIFGAEHPIAIGERELKLIAGDAERFGNFLHEMQSVDAYYATPKVFRRKDGSVFGVYILTEDVKTIVPFKPGLLMNDELKVDDWNITMVGKTNIRGAAAYEDFLKGVDQSEIYDTEHFLVTLSSDKIGELVSLYGKEL